MPNWYPIIFTCPVRSDSCSYISNIYIFVYKSISEIATFILSMSLDFIIAWKKDKWYNKRVLIWRFTWLLILKNYGQIGDQKGSFTQQTQYFIQDSRSGGNQCFFPGMFGNLWLLLKHKPVGLLTCEVHGRFYWPGLSGLWLNRRLN